MHGENLVGEVTVKRNSSLGLLSTGMDSSHEADSIKLLCKLFGSAIFLEIEKSPFYDPDLPRLFFASASTITYFGLVSRALTKFQLSN
jgi:hypothetical protein